MLKEDDARDLVEELRRLVRERGFESFDAHATMLIMTSAGTQEPIHTAAQALNVYSNIVIQLLRSVGAERINEAKSNIAKALELDDITIELDLSDIGPMLLADTSNKIELEGIDDADQLAGEIEQFNRAVGNFSYPDPDPDPDLGPANGGPSP